MIDLSVKSPSRLCAFFGALLLAAWSALVPAGLGAQESHPAPDEPAWFRGLSAGQKQIAEAALGLQGRGDLRLADRSFPWDCSGTALASLWNAGLDLTGEYGAAEGNGVSRLHEIVVRHDLEYDLPLPEIGDLVFWDNTYDRNGDKLWNDPLTHVGVVVGVDSNGTIDYLHHDYRRGIVIAHMNLFYPMSQYGILPDGTRIEINSPLRMSSQRYLNPTRWLSSHLFRSFGRLHLLIDRNALNTAAATIPGSKS
jgi:hypothetical protein